MDKLFCIFTCMIIFVSCSQKSNIHQPSKESVLAVPANDEASPIRPRIYITDDYIDKQINNVFDWNKLQSFVDTNTDQTQNMATNDNDIVYNSIAGIYNGLKDSSNDIEYYSNNLTTFIEHTFTWGKDLMPEGDYIYIDLEANRWHKNERVDHEYFNAEIINNDSFEVTNTETKSKFDIKVTDDKLFFREETLNKISGPKDRFNIIKKMLQRRLIAEKGILPKIISPNAAREQLQGLYETDFNEIVQGKFEKILTRITKNHIFGFRDNYTIKQTSNQNEIQEQLASICSNLTYAGFNNLVHSQIYFNEYKYIDIEKIYKLYPDSIIVELLAGHSTLVVEIYMKESNAWHLSGVLDYVDRE